MLNGSKGNIMLDIIFIIVFITVKAGGCYMAVNRNYKGGRIISSHGYIRIRKPDHPNSDVAGYIYEHRLIAEKILKRHLKKEEIVHHKDGDRKNNSPDNLEILENIAYHKYLHRKKADMRKPEEKNILIKCKCGCGIKFKKFDKSGRPRKYLFPHSWRKGKLSYNPNEKIKCGCGCGKILNKHDEYGRIRKFKKGHRRKKNG